MNFSNSAGLVSIRVFKILASHYFLFREELQRERRGFVRDKPTEHSPLECVMFFLYRDFPTINNIAFSSTRTF